MSTIRLTWFRNKTYSYNTATHLNTAYIEYAKQKAPSSKVQLNAVLMDLMVANGYLTGNLQTRLLKFYRVKTGLPIANFATAERQFYLNNALDYTASGGGTSTGQPTGLLLALTYA